MVEVTGSGWSISGSIENATVTGDTNRVAYFGTILIILLEETDINR